MSRNEIFLFLVCALATAIMASPLSSSRSQQRVTIVSLLSPAEFGSLDGPVSRQHGLDHR